MAVKLTDKSALASVPVNDDVMLVVDISDSTASSDGTSFKIEYAQLMAKTTHTISTTTYTFVISDANNFILFSNAGAITITIPTNSAVPWPIGTHITLCRKGAGLPTIVGDTGVNFVAKAGYTDISPRYGVAKLSKIAADQWILSGDLG